MKAIILKTNEIQSVLQRVFERFHDGFSRNGSGNAISLAAPVLLLVACLASGMNASFAELATIAACIIGMSMIFSALGLMGVSSRLLISLNYGAYGLGLASLSFMGYNTAALWLLAAALPLEIWFTTRKSVSTYIGIIIALGLIGLFTANSSGSISGGSIASVMMLVLYTASLVLRSFIIKFQKPNPVVISSNPVLASGDIRFELDTDGLIRNVDEQSAERIGVAPHTLIGTALLDRIHVADRVCYLSMLADLRRNIIAAAIDVRLRTLESGSTVFLNYRLEGSSLEGSVILLGRSLENEQKLIQEIDVLKAELEAERHGRGRLLATVSHELRTPLNSIIGFSDLLSLDMKKSGGLALEGEKQREYAGLIRDSGHYLLELVNSVLDTTRLEEGSYRIEPVSFAFRETVELCASVILPQAQQKGIAFCHRVTAATGDLVADRCAVKQILMNLTANAVKFTEPGGCVTVDASRKFVEGNEILEITVADTGIGIAPEDMQRLGTPFVRASNSYVRAQEGSGLGLSLVKGLVELHQGHMQIKSSPAQGTIVIVQLPVDGPKMMNEECSDPLGESDQQLGTVIEMHRHQGEWNNDWQKDENSEEGDAQTRKTA